MTLEETREQIANKERELQDLKNRKTELFQQLKKVLAEQDNKKNSMPPQQHQQHHSYIKDR